MFFFKIIIFVKKFIVMKFMKERLSVIFLRKRFNLNWVKGFVYKRIVLICFEKKRILFLLEFKEIWKIRFV